MQALANDNVIQRLQQSPQAPQDFPASRFNPAQNTRG